MCHSQPKTAPVVVPRSIKEAKCKIDRARGRRERMPYRTVMHPRTPGVARSVTHKKSDRP